MAQVTGTFTATGASNSITVGGKAFIILDFGTGTVDIQVQHPTTGSWVTTDSKTADYAGIFEGPAVMRLNCSAYTADIAYSVTT